MTVQLAEGPVPDRVHGLGVNLPCRLVVVKVTVPDGVVAFPAAVLVTVAVQRCAGVLVAVQLREVRSVLQQVSLEGEGLVPAYLQPLLREAWPEVELAYADFEGRVASEAYEDQFVAAGLRGRQFQVKVEGFRRHLSVFRRRREPRWLKKLLRWADVILGSLVAIVPGGDAVKEFKEAVEAGAEDVDDGSAGEADAVPPEV